MTGLSTTFLAKLRTYPSLPSQTWYYITLVTISICNKPELIAPVLSHAFTYSAIPGSTDAAYVKEERAWLARNPGKLGRIDEEGRESALRILRRCREGLVKSGAIGGIPKAINALYHLRKCHEPHLLDPLPEYSSSSSPSSSSSSPSIFSSLHPLSSPYPTSRPNSLPPNTLNAYKDPSPTPISSSPPSPTTFPTNPTLPFLARGSDFFTTLYGPTISKKVLANLQKSSPDLQILATWIYALILSEGTVLTPRETSFVLIAALIPQDVNAQLKPHLVGAINNGADREEVDGVRGCVMEICKELGVAWKGEVARL
ncbi:hypothetical protein TWF225_009388 [Orbilia oligospora]|uniref:Uncharacterized protein n=1 Tax=Orbilia oligospora TaxID=2813651 RepID=A0A7C8TRV8_ORBOL|nr:hypothetical protein TWF751_001961 [Orbilia oligospora]KAF3193846.1 hypothetical protein TWF225_009388 [Orbilia oligospora]KAF3270033.1 hypothetical protein TWF217_008375 [Orbilia oligospora]KAF3270499.1 hypothetical protein TWF128_004264 [Orbilia oligospora]KAF3298015.1 hypothetical protein TWF132_004159 [Orbilia oligospora]